MATPSLPRQDKTNPAEWSRANGTPRYTSRSGSLPPCRPAVIAARLFIPAFASAAAWTSLWIGPFYAAILAVWTCWAVTAVARRLPFSGSDHLRQAAFGERIWLNQLRQQGGPLLKTRIPAHYLASWAGLTAAVLGGLFASSIVTGTGLIVAVITQYMCFQHLAAFYGAQKTAHPLYRFWDARPANDDCSKATSAPTNVDAPNRGRKRQRPTFR